MAPAEAKAAIDRSNDIQDALWANAKRVAAKDNAMAPTGIYIQALNEMFDNQEKRLTALRNRVPNIVLLALLCDHRRRDRLHWICERTRDEAMAVARLCHEHLGCGCHLIDSGCRRSKRRVRFRQRAADDRHRGQSRTLCLQVGRRRARALKLGMIENGRPEPESRAPGPLPRNWTRQRWRPRLLSLLAAPIAIGATWRRCLF